MVVFSGLAVLPDLDYVGVMLGVPNVGACGHRGASHSLLAPMLVALATAMAAPHLQLPRWRASIIAGLAVASHSFLDALTASGRGIPLLWPLSFYRFEIPWRPIPDAPCGLAFVSWAGFRVACTELLLFLPVFVFALRPRASRRLQPIVLRGNAEAIPQASRPS